MELITIEFFIGSHPRHNKLIVTFMQFVWNILVVYLKPFTEFKVFYTGYYSNELTKGKFSVFFLYNVEETLYYN
ncbi:hypothetical protein DERP_008097 [Dermatophagoides pteronyssinus]|uniref:Uncharacterized protein n=1 Tax=Dermatophagoides pteronyssinus TaxID=6956 RepID=A0ABQ8JJT9_DERPT|nr:hypothetical protein DERP_008097 [Dermatophagoides pteronyssinus]